MTNKEKSLAILKSHSIAFDILEHSKKVYTCSETALERKVPLNQVVKTLLCFDKRKNLNIFMLPGSEHLDQHKARKFIESNKLKFVPSPILEKEYGLIIGAISPLLLIGKGRFVMDAALTHHDFVTISTGDPGSGLKIGTKDLMTLIGCEVGVISS